MTMTLQELSDRIEINDLMVDYATAVDTQNIDALDDVFTPDAFIDYSAFGGSKGDLESTIAFLHKAMKIFPNHQHLNANHQIKLDGDRATGKVMCWNPQELAPKDGEDTGHIFFCGLWYHDEYVRTEAGWRIAKRVEQKSYVFNKPEFMKAG